MSETTAQIIDRLAKRRAGVSEATIQADVRSLILAARLNLVAENVEDVNLESPTGDGTQRRIDVEVSTTVIEVKQSLDNEKALRKAEAQLAGYVHGRVAQTGARFYGILTDGRVWRLYIPDVGTGKDLLFVSEMKNAGVNDEAKLLDWLGAVLSRVEGIYPTAGRIEQALGSSSPAYRADHATLRALFRAGVDHPEVDLKRELWGKLLTTAFGEGYEGDVDLFVDHTLLVLTAEVIAHAVLGFDVSRTGGLTPQELADGSRFSRAAIYGVVESDFFDWPLLVEGGPEFVASLAHRLTRFDWAHVDHDVLKHVYESVVTPDTRRQLGEYYTPDWLAERMLQELDYDPLGMKVLDASCGSGTFVFHAVRRYLDHARTEGISDHDAIAGVVQHVYGMDLHPVAVALARVTYLLAIGGERLRGHRPAFSVPVYIGDSVQWEQSTNLFAEADTVTIPTSGSHILSEGEGMLFDSALRIPVSVMRNTQRFDAIVNRIGERVASFQAPDGKRRDQSNPTRWVKQFRNDLEGALAEFKLTKDELEVLVTTGGKMYELEVLGRDHVWAYYIRNLIRPIWLSMPENRVDLLIGNPPWLRYDAMNQWMKERFTQHSRDHNLIIGNLGISGRDLSTLFVVRACELYLKTDGAFAYVMPHSSLTRRSSAGFRTGTWALRGGTDDGYGQFESVWDLKGVSTGFPITSGVIFGRTSQKRATKLPAAVTVLKGSFTPASQPWTKVKDEIVFSKGRLRQIGAETLPQSPYGRRFRAGAILYPRRLMWAVETDAGPLGTAGGSIPLRSRVTNDDKVPWRIDPLEASVDPEYIFDGYLGEHLLPYRVQPAGKVIVPAAGDKLMSAEEAQRTPGLSSWWTQAETRWVENRKPGTTKSLAERIDYHKQLSAQLETRASYYVLYPASGNTIAATWVAGSSRPIIEHKAYWYGTDSLSEARYLTGILNSATMVKRVQPLQSAGLMGPRDIDKYPFTVLFGLFDDDNDLHGRLVDLVAKAEDEAAAVDLSKVRGFKSMRKVIREALEESGISREIDGVVEEILPEIAVDDDEEGVLEVEASAYLA